MAREKENTFDYYDGEQDRFLQSTHIKGINELKNAAARQHSMGFNRRVGMLAISRQTIEKRTHSPADEPIGALLALELSIHLNAYYMNLCGALDNLTWVMQYEWSVLPGISESSPRRQWCSLFHSEFRKALNITKPALIAGFDNFADWYGELRKLRDPATHRVPLTAIPGWVTEEQAAERKKIEAVAIKTGNDGDVMEMFELMHKASMLGQYEPLMSVWTPESEKLVNAWDSILRDHRQFQKLATVITQEIFL